MTQAERTLLLRAGGAVVLPVAAVLAWRSVYLAAWWDTAVAMGWAAWVGAAIVAALPMIELWWWPSLWHLLRSGGRASIASARMNAPDAIARRKRRWFRLAAGIGSVAVALMLCEIGFRLLDITPPPRPREQIHDNQAVDNTLNALGIREDWDSLSENDPRLRIALLGDSMTYGDGVEPSATFCHLVETLLAEQVPRGVVTINLGKSGTSPVDQIDVYRRVRDALRPELVVHVLYPNDLDGLYTNNTMREIHALSVPALWLSGQSYLCRYVEHQVRARLAMRETVLYFRGGRDEAQREAAWTEVEEAVRATQGLVESDGATYCIVFHPWLFQLEGSPLASEHARMAAFARSLGVPYLDLLPAFAGRDADELRISSINEHANAAGHRIAAEAIARFLADEVLPTIDGTLHRE